MKKMTFFLLLWVLFMGNSMAFGADILYWTDGTEGIDRMEEALKEDSLDLDLTIAQDAENFNALAASQGWDLIVLALQNTLIYDVSNFKDYVSNGGRAIFCTTDPCDAFLVSLFGAGFLGNFDEPLVTVNSDDLAAGLASNPLILTPASWGCPFSCTMCPLCRDEDFEMAVYETHKSAIILSNQGRTLINGFLTNTVPDDILFVNEIRYLLPDLAADSASGGSGGCNMIALASAGLLLLAPLALVLKKTR